MIPDPFRIKQLIHASPAAECSYHATLVAHRSIRIFCRFSIVNHTLEINQYNGFVTNYPGIVARWQHGHVARFAVEQGAVVHLDAQGAADVVLKMRRQAAVCLYDRLNRS